SIRQFIQANIAVSNPSRGGPHFSYWPGVGSEHSYPWVNNLSAATFQASGRRQRAQAARGVDCASQWTGRASELAVLGMKMPGGLISLIMRLAEWSFKADSGPSPVRYGSGPNRTRE